MGIEMDQCEIKKCKIPTYQVHILRLWRVCNTLLTVIVTVRITRDAFPQRPFLHQHWNIHIVL